MLRRFGRAVTRLEKARLEKAILEKARLEKGLGEGTDYLENGRQSLHPTDKQAILLGGPFSLTFAVIGLSGR
jgi:hypothetical protein